MNNTLSIYGSHDAGAVYIDRFGYLKVLEYERFVKRRYAMFSSAQDHREYIGSNDKERNDFLEYIRKDKGSYDITKVVHNEISDADQQLILKYFPNAVFIKKGHHEAHAACGYYQSGFKDALIFSVDGGGVDYTETSTTRVYYGERNTINLLSKVNADFGGPYGDIGSPISEIRPGPDSKEHSLAYAGKVMGLCAYGTPNTDWYKPMIEYYKTNNIHELGQKINLDTSFNALSGQQSYDLAATSQAIFENGMMNLIKHFHKDCETNIVLVGGCALNVLFNQKLSDHLKGTKFSLYVPPNPNDCGLALGQFLLEHPYALTGKPVTYRGFELLDSDGLWEYSTKRNAKRTDTKEIVKLLKQGKIIGIIQGYSEVGPRALGNRSIICDPSIPNMKDIINSKVKFREWYRPFAPVCRLEDKDTYFENACESVYMSYAPTVKAEYREKLRSVTHVDNTARLQTVTKQQHSFFYDILSELSNINEIPIILNTSFNVKGKPILTTIEDALHVLDTTQLDYVVAEGILFTKT